MSEEVERTEIAELKTENCITELNDLFPVVKIPESNMDRYNKISLTGLSALGAAFSQLPQSSRTVVQTITKEIASKEKLYVGLNPKGVIGELERNELGISGNIRASNEQGKNVIVGRMRFKEVDSLPVTESGTFALPVDPTLMVVAVAIMAFEQKLDSIQASVEEVLKFLELEKQSKQRGNLRMLSEISEEYKIMCNDKHFCTSRTNTVQQIQMQALHDIEFYQEKVASELKKKNAFHLSKDTAAKMTAITHEFAEYQLACYIYSYCSFLDVMLRRNFESVSIDMAVSKMRKMADRYDHLYTKCHAEIAHHQRSSIESKFIGGVGIAAKKAGRTIGAIPLVKEGPVDEALISVGKSLGKVNYRAVSSRLTEIERFGDNRMRPFITSLNKVDLLYNTPNSMLTDGESLFVIGDGSRVV